MFQSPQSFVTPIQEAWVAPANPWTLDAFIAWLERQPAEGVYNWADCEGGCLMGLYSVAIGDGHKSWAYRIGDVECIEYTMHAEVAMPRPWTFGAALDRARALREAGV